MLPCQSRSSAREGDYPRVRGPSKQAGSQSFSKLTRALKGRSQTSIRCELPSLGLHKGKRKIRRKSPALKIHSAIQSGAKCGTSEGEGGGGTESGPTELEYEVREAKKDDWWQVAEIHCRSFYPRATGLLGVLLRFDRVESLKNGQDKGDEDESGEFACFGAWLSDTAASNLQSADRIMRAHAYKRMPAFLQIFVARPLRANFQKTPEDSGMVGTVIVDSLGVFVPQRKLKGFSPERSGIAYVSNLAVHQCYRRRGIGRRLLSRTIQAARNWNCRAILLQCDPKNRGARQMYVDAGFRHVAYEPQFLQFLEGRIGTRLELMIKKLEKLQPAAA